MAYTTINKHTDYFNTKLYSGNASTQSITGVGFAPDLVWIKERSSTSSNVLGNTISGTQKRLQSDTTSAEGTLTNIFTSFDSDGFTHGADNGVNESGQTYASWNWLAGGASSSNTDGSITSTVSVNTTAGFSIVQYTGTGSAGTIGHGLGVAPACIIIKTRNTTSDWFVYHQSTGATNRSKLNENVVSSASTFLNDTAPSSTVFNTEGGGATGTNGNTYVAFCFAEKQGYSKFGSYIGNSSANYGSFIYTGFRPSFFLVKNTQTAEDWMIYDNKRDPNNVMQTRLRANRDLADTTNTDYYMDFLSNGIKLYAGNSAFNANSNKMIFMAFGQSLVGSNNVPCTAR